MGYSHRACSRDASHDGVGEGEVAPSCQTVKTLPLCCSRLPSSRNCREPPPAATLNGLPIAFPSGPIHSPVKPSMFASVYSRNASVSCERVVPSARVW